MNETIVDQLIQKVSNLITEVNDVNLKIRELTPAQEVMNKTNVRLNALQGAAVEMEKTMSKLDERLGTMERQLKSLPQALESLGKSIDQLPEKAGMSVKSVDQLKKQMAALSERLGEPQQQDVYHHHHLKKGLVIAIATSVLSAVLFVFLVASWSRIDLEKERDIKYRYLQVLDNPSIEGAIQWVDSAYLSDPDKFRKGTVEWEERQEQLRRLRTQNERNNAEIKKAEGKK